MNLPTYEEQNKWLSDYIQPIFDLDFKRIADNYKQNKREALRQDMKKAGIMSALQGMDERGMSPLDQILQGMRGEIKAAKDKREYEAFLNSDEHKEYVKMIDLVFPLKNYVGTYRSMFAQQEVSGGDSVGSGIRN